MAESCEVYIQSQAYADFIIPFAGDVESVRRRYDAACVTAVNAAFAIIQIPVGRMASAQNFGYNTMPKVYGLMDSTNMDASGIRRVQNQPFLSLKGENMLIGVIDTGIDFTQPVFRQADGTTRIAAIWDQTIQGDDISLQVAYGTEYREAEINQALLSEDPFSIVPTTDAQGHGTFLAGIVAGNADSANDFTGAAPLAQIVAVKLKQAKSYLREFYRIPQDALAYQETDIMMAFRYLHRMAIQLQKPIAICIGLGTNSGNHLGNSYLSQYMDYVGSLRGICVAAAAGNEGNRGTHYYGMIEDAGDFEDVEIRVDSDEYGFVVELWGYAPDIFSVGFISPGGEVVEKIQAGYGQSQQISFALDPTKIYLYYDPVTSASGNPLIFMRFETPSAGIWTIRVYGDRILYRRYHMWLPIGNFIKSGTYFLRPDPNTTVTSPGDTKNVICTTAYNHYSNSIYVQAGRGFLPDNRVVPDIAAPGVNIYGPAIGIGYTRKSGTSVAAAHAAGAAALMLEWGIYQRNNLNMDTTEIKRMLIRGADREDDIQYPSRIWGFGTMDLFESFQ